MLGDSMKGRETAHVKAVGFFLGEALALLPLMLEYQKQLFFKTKNQNVTIETF